MAQGTARWRALESSPEVLTSLARSLTGQERWCVRDVWSLDDEVLDMCVDEEQADVAAVVLLFPSRKDAPMRTTTEEDRRATSGMYFLEQDAQNGKLANACGTIAVCHALANADHVCALPSASVLGNFVQETRSASAADRGSMLDGNDAVHEVHAELVQRGQSEVLESENVQHHFVTFVERRLGDAGGSLVVELDGYYNDGPAVVGRVARDQSFLQSAAAVIRKRYIDATVSRTSSETRIDFSVLVLLCTKASKDSKL